MFSKGKSRQATVSVSSAQTLFLSFFFFPFLCRGSWHQVGEPATTCSCPAHSEHWRRSDTPLSVLSPQWPRAAPSSAPCCGRYLVEGPRRLAAGEPHLPPASPPRTPPNLSGACTCCACSCSAHSYLDPVSDQQRRCVPRRFERQNRRNDTVF